jgi:hypothetical protein
VHFSISLNQWGILFGYDLANEVRELVCSASVSMGISKHYVRGYSEDAKHFYGMKAKLLALVLPEGLR